jgi:hypothetical protein
MTKHLFLTFDVKLTYSNQNVELRKPVHIIDTTLSEKPIPLSTFSQTIYV